MNFPRCPHLDSLGRQLIEAYRRIDDDQLWCFAVDIENPDSVTKIHLLIMEHRNACPICHQIARAVHEVDETNHICTVH